MFALIDCNNFYASCERVFAPNLNDRPVVVLSNNDGCVIARSNEAKKLKIPMGAPAFQYRQVFERHQVYVFSSNYALYGDMSQRVMSILSQYSPDIEIYSIDESFLKFSGFDDHFDLEAYALDIIHHVHKSTGIPISVGIAPTKSLAKVANKVAKKFPVQTQGAFILRERPQIEKALKWTKIEDIWGIGRQYARKLQAIQVFNALDFIHLPNAYVLREMSQVGLRLKKELEGFPALDLETNSPKKNIAVTRAFSKSLEDFDSVRERISTYAGSLAYKLRKQGSCCQMLYVFIHTNPHRPDLPRYANQIALHCPFPTNSTFDLVNLAIKGLRLIFKNGHAFKKAGLIAMNLVPESKQQLSLFEQNDPRHATLMKVMDRLNLNFPNSVRVSSQDFGRTWKMRQERLSPRYTTQLKEVIKVQSHG